MEKQIGKAFLLAIGLMAGSLDMNSQTSYSAQLNDQLFAPAPNTASIEKRGKLPMLLYTGTANISFPLCEISQGTLKLPVVLSYNYNGYRPKEDASWVGLGWTLPVGGVITRVIKGAPDGHLSQGRNFGEYPVSNFNSQSFLQQCFDINNLYDIEPDIYSYSFGNYSGNFYFVKDKAYIFPYEPLKIEKTGLDEEQQIKITTPDGNVYHFDSPEISTVSATQHGDRTFMSALYLTRIVAANKIDVLFIDYEQERHLEDATGATQTFTRTESNNPERGNGSEIISSNLNGRKTIQAKRISAIRSDHTTIEFIPSSAYRTDLDVFDPVTMTSQCKYLKDIAVFENRNGVKKLVKQIRFDMEYFNADQPNNAKLKLKRFYELGGEALEKNNQHEFVYENESNSFPDKSTKGIDHWGFYNGKNSNANLFPKSVLQFYVSSAVAAVGNNTDRIPNLEFAKYGALSRIIYPTGGSSEFQYELNELSSDYYANKWYVARGVYPEALYTSGGPNPASTTISFYVNTPQRINCIYARIYNDCSSINTRLNPPVVTITDEGNNIVFESINPEDCLEHSRLIDLPPGQYFATVKCPSNATRSYANINFLELDMSKARFGPGIRLKKITSSPGNSLGLPLQSEYAYESGEGTSSGTLREELRYDKKVQTLKECGVGGVLTYYSTTYTALSTAMNSVLAGLSEYSFYYSRVIEKETGENQVLETESIFEFEHDRFRTLKEVKLKTRKFYKYLTSTSKQLVREENYVNKSIEDTFALGHVINLLHTNSSNSTFTCGCNNLPGSGNPCRDFQESTYGISQRWNYLEKQQIIEYDPAGNTLTSETVYEYKSLWHRNLTDLYTKNSTGETVLKRYKYPQDYVSDIPLVGAMLLNDVTAPAIEEQSWKLISPTVSSLVGGKITAYHPSFFLPEKQYLLEVSKGVVPDNEARSGGKYLSLISDSRYKERVATKYNTSGKPIEENKSDDHYMAYYWGYDDDYPVAKIIGAEHKNVFYTSFEDADGNSTTGDSKTGAKSRTNGYSKSLSGLTNGNYVLSYWQKSGSNWVLQTVPVTVSGSYIINLTGQVDEVRFYPTNAQMITYTYDPLVGITSQCDATNRVTYYEYDLFGRLMHVLDEDRNVVKKIDYQFQKNYNQ